MSRFLRKRYRKFKKKNKFFWSVNWIKTYYFNYKKFPYAVAKKLPVFFYGKVKFSNISGEVIIDAPIKKAMIGFGQTFEFPTTSKGTSEISLKGAIVFKGNVQIGKDVCLLIDKGAYFEMGHFSCLGSSVLLICKNKIVLGSNVRVGFQVQFIDTSIHQLIDLTTNKKLPLNGSIFLDDNNWVGNRTTIMKNTKTPVNCITASNSLINKDYTPFGENILIGGLPAKLLKENISRDWEGEREKLEKSLILY
jgi:acetyltransferase-like isoleucine patch superfamily enzyme|tara:strand:- start:35376 stop:36125 length:750 start_codon:yes stop_codon:yes gene_type:complete